ncbi:RNase adapter RapZ [Galactobacter valiniphilus]|uniref:RNase adapter RapZ n=1 Tax=Galactobacter valiniphilus TaxID=2676122 RepID=A0A399JDL5_9MICC|nr:RNase adapter RapZ [Galactobacter valiniphilus]RII42122.1 RNase adapter RapZ [Galactobacter valiniphilus]
MNATPEVHKPQQSEIVVLTGMSGAGRTTAAHALEDMGWYVVDNLPPQMLQTLTDLVARTPEALPKLSVGVDIRSRGLFPALRESLEAMRAAGLNYRVVFLDADDDVLVRRFEQGRRPHPLQGDGRIVDGIDAERVLMAELKDTAEIVMDTSRFNVHELAAAVHEVFSDEGPITLRLNVMSFGFKYGLPVDANYVADVRFVPNPHWIPELRPHTGQDPDVRDYVLAAGGTREFIEHYVAALAPVFEGYRRERKHYATIAVGCTGGKHRSVAIAEEIARRLTGFRDVRVSVVHRDLGRE